MKIPLMENNTLPIIFLNTIGRFLSLNIHVDRENVPTSIDMVAVC